ncbi:phage holin family protein [bacterium]|nr:phage holin family protein [bacterium]
MKLILKWVLFALAIVFIGWLIPGISVANFVAALIMTIAIALVNIFIRPLIEFISMPINFLTLGLFTLVINTLLFMLAGYFVTGISIDGFLSALLGSLVLSVLGVVIDSLTA